MQRFLAFPIAAAFTCTLAATAAYAHAFLDRAVPGVGATVSGSPSELELGFTQNIVPAFSGVSLATASDFGHV
jgi:methionine-rich copper-binding protein CopC